MKTTLNRQRPGERLNPTGSIVTVQSGQTRPHAVQAQYLRELLYQRRLSAEEVAKRSMMIARQLGSPESSFSRQAVTSWMNGTRSPRLGNRQLLAKILQVSLEELNRKCGGAIQDLSLAPLFCEVNVRVYGRDEEVFGYNLTLPCGTDLSQPAVYRHWGDMFSSRPAQLMRHFRRLKYKLYGWIPDDAGSPLVLRYPCLVPLHTDRLSLDVEGVNQCKVWFVCSPDRLLQVGFAYREQKSLVLFKGRHVAAKKYPLSTVDLIGYVSGKTLFQVQTGSDQICPEILQANRISA